MKNNTSSRITQRVFAAFIWIVIIVVIPVITHAQHTLPANGMYLTGRDYSAHQLTDGFDKGAKFKFHVNRMSMEIAYDSTSHTYFRNDTWGYRQNGEDRRIWLDQDYIVESTGKICIYHKPVRVQGYQGMNIFFSHDLLSPVYVLNRENLLAVFHEDSLFVSRIRNLSVLRSLYRKDKSTDRYLFESWMR